MPMLLALLATTVLATGDAVETPVVPPTTDAAPAADPTAPRPIDDAPAAASSVDVETPNALPAPPAEAEAPVVPIAIADGDPATELRAGVRLDYDLAAAARALGIGVDLERGHAGLAFALLFTEPLGLRAEGRYVLVDTRYVDLLAGAGATLFVPAIGLRGGLAAELALGPVVVETGLAYERYLNNPLEFRDAALLVSAAVGWVL